MSSYREGGPAFPQYAMDDRGDFAPGMTLRDWFAGNEIIDTAEDHCWELLEALAGPRPQGTWSSNPIEWFSWSNKWQAAVKYARADAMLEARRGGAK